MKLLSSFVLSTAVLVGASDAAAQVRVQTAPRGFAYVLGDPDRAMIGISTRSSGRRDTLGLLVESVTRDGPADKAGIEEGDRLVAVNKVNLRLSAMDAGEPDMEGVANRRLIRQLEKVKAGDEVELSVYRDGATRTVRVKTVAADELNKQTFASTSGTFSRVTSDRAVLGVSLGGSGSRRDTLGVLIVGVADDGPAAKAGIDEGDRLAAINGVDLRVAGEDAGDWQASSARIRRLNREMEKVKAGDAVELRVYSNGQLKTVRVEAAKASDVEGDSFFFDGAGGLMKELRALPVPRSGRILFRSPALGEVRKLPAVAIPKMDVERKIRAADEVMRSSVEPLLKQRLQSAAEVLRKVRRTVII